MTRKTPFVTVQRDASGIYTFECFQGDKDEAKELLENCMETLEQIFGQDAARSCAERVFKV